jgi:hypothetical protein
MKRLIMVNGTMGAGKTATCNELLNIVQPGVFLDGDWCWNMKPFTVTEETKALVLRNICFSLNNFLACSEFENIIFCWVMHEESILDEILSQLSLTDVAVDKFSLILSKEALTKRIGKDILDKKRHADVLSRSISRIALYEKMDTTKIDVSAITAKQAANKIASMISQAVS